MLTLAEVMLQTGRNLEATIEGSATGAAPSTSTLIDTNLSAAAYGQGWADDDFNGATLLYVYRAAAAAPPRNIRVVIDYEAAASKLTVDQPFWYSVAPVSTGLEDLYAIISKNYPRGQIAGIINQALQDLGDVVTEDTSLTTAANQREYTFPTDEKRRLLEVWIAQSTAAPYRWEHVLGVKHRQRWTGAGDTGLLEFFDQPRVGYKIRLVYLGPHPVVSVSTGVVQVEDISTLLSPDWLALEAALRLARWRLQQPGANEQKLTALLNDLTTRTATARRRRTNPPPNVQPIFPFTEFK